MGDSKLDLHPRQPPKVYSVPRRFGIGTLMGVATAGALLVWAMQMLDWPPVVIICNGVFLTLIGAMQVVLIKTPRWASILVGVVCVVTTFSVVLLRDTYRPGLVDLARLFVGAGVGGVIYGYLGGVLVAGVFLVMDGLSSLLTRRQSGDES